MTRWAICQPRWLRDLDEFDGHPRGDNCQTCRRDIAVNRTWTGNVLCIYCAIERGWLEDAPLGEHQRVILDDGDAKLSPAQTSMQLSSDLK